MKTVLKTMCAAAFFIGSLSFAQSGKLAPKPPKVIVTIEPGSFSAGIFGCWGNGYCRRETAFPSASCEKNTTITNNGDGTLLITFDYSKFNSENQKYYSDRKEFIVENVFELNDYECESLHLLLGTKLATGNYPISRDGIYMNVTVKTL